MNIEGIKAREQAATPGPWEVKTNRHPETTGEAWGWIRGPFENWCWTDRRSRSRPDAEFVAHARTDIPALLAEVERLTEENTALHDTVDKLVTQNRRIINRELGRDQQIATLKKALEIACKDHADGCRWYPDSVTVESLMEYYIRETQPHQAQEQEGKK